MQGARALVDVLAGSGVEHVFGLPGDTGMAFYDALRDARGAIEHVMTRDERSASFMADVYARVSGRIGVCEGPSGGGATYILPGVAEAQGSAIPLLCLTSDTPVDQQGRGVLTELDQESLFRPVTKWNTRVSSAATMAEAARRAIRMATAGRPGATHLSLPTDALEGESPDASVYGVPEFGAAPAMRTIPDQALVERAAAELAAATRPVIVAGGGVLTSGAWNELTLLGERLEYTGRYVDQWQRQHCRDERCRDRCHRRQRSAAVCECLSGRCRSRALHRIPDRLDDDVPLDAAADRQRAKSHSDRRRAVRSGQQLPSGRRPHRRCQTDAGRAARGDRST